MNKIQKKASNICKAKLYLSIYLSIFLSVYLYNLMNLYESISGHKWSICVLCLGCSQAAHDLNSTCSFLLVPQLLQVFQALHALMDLMSFSFHALKIHLILTISIHSVHYEQKHISKMSFKIYRKGLNVTREGLVMFRFEI